ncbi:hypothetical protein HJC23_001361 [Cyclotella cryptica]|uniref:PS II complex 12 kDa extrinsic protein n=1 Tax=Cyclotella cryptica TaxID=29204 RepID=A0ABD3PNH4_9STRA|eukprot:CCRYP_013135-RA/>CCRYP_013135-RA protein AED:0.38 eAED:0.38 QI:131/1/1/1/1/1/2/1147/209
MLKRTLFILALTSPHSQAAFLSPRQAVRSPVSLLANSPHDALAELHRPAATSALHARIGDRIDHESRSETTRRTAIQRAVALVTMITSSRVANADVIRSPGRCANGEGSGCESLAEGNELIQSLQRKSLENKAENQREALYAYYMKNYPDVFALSDKRMVMKQDGTFALFSAEEVKDMTKSGRIMIEYPKTKGGRVADLTQKPILVLKK